MFADHGLETAVITSLQNVSEGMASDPIWTPSPEELALDFEQEVSNLRVYFLC